jgi:transcriptional regulator with XRE-family HTH domain
MDIGKAIKRVREQQCVTQKELSKRCGISTSGISSMEISRVFTYSKKRLIIICEALEIPLALLYLLAMEANDFPKGGVKEVNRLSEQYFEEGDLGLLFGEVYRKQL